MNRTLTLTLLKLHFRTDYLERRKVLMAWWSEHIEEAATGSLSMSGKKSLKVVG